MLFKDRVEAGQQLASRLAPLADRHDVVVLALPRGGVPVGFEVAKALNAPLDIFVVRKLGVPGQEELAMGAIASGNTRVLNTDVIHELGMSEPDIDAVAAREGLKQPSFAGEALFSQSCQHRRHPCRIWPFAQRARAIRLIEWVPAFDLYPWNRWLDAAKDCSVTRRAVLQVRMPRLRHRIGVQADETGLRMRDPEKIQRAFPFIKVNDRQAKPRSRGVTEIRGPYYTPMGKHYLQDVLQTMGKYVDALKFAGGSFALMPRDAVKELIDLCHAHEVLVSTGGFIERVLAQGQQAVEAYIEECKKLGFDIIEISSGFISIPADDWLRLVEKVQKAGLKAKPEIGIQFGAGGATSAEELAAEGTRDPEGAIMQAQRFLEAGSYMIMVESEGITENVKTWRTEVPAKIANTLGLEKVMFEAADPEVFAWYIKNYGPEVNLFVDHSQIVQLECLRSGIWGTKSLWGRVLTYKG